MEDFNNQIFLISSFLELGTIKIRLAISYFLGEGTYAVIASDIYNYLLVSYYNFLIKNPKLAVDHNLFMVKTVDDIRRDTLIGVKSIRTALDTLVDKGLVVRNKTGLNNCSVYKINTDFFLTLEKNYNEYEAYRDNKIEEKEEKKEKQIENIKNNAQKVDIETLNNTDLSDPEEVEKLNLGPCISRLVYLMGNYYKDYTGKDYRWNEVKFNTLMSEWKKYYRYPGIEISLTNCLYRELFNDKSKLGGKIPLEKRMTMSFNHDRRKIEDLEEKAIFKNYLREFIDYRRN